MKPINETHLAEPGLAVVGVAAADGQTAFAAQKLLAGRWATAPADRTTRVPGPTAATPAASPGGQRRNSSSPRGAR
ncbi:DUF6207 family protein [Streptomyces sp. DH10]|uniref:DUF6207 family protein n=1 Tax=Streptomyces sp. DH10 TaxID=3040121 RepID=UPI002442D7FE|nr:DUF6207 family protein [Streptomyces sp. DH10]MDG9709407.1 DUF6207 family protein [Streptomyces sp. DH10]